MGCWLHLLSKGAKHKHERAGTILFKDRSHKLHALFYDEVCTTPREKQASIADFYQFNAQELPFFDQFPTVTPSGVPGSACLGS